MTNTDRILEALEAHGPLTDRELRERTAVEPHQQVNQICRSLEARGVVSRQRRSDGRIVNALVDRPLKRESPLPTPQTFPSDRQPGPDQDWGGTAPRQPAPLDDGRARLVLIPCSGRKVSGGHGRRSGPSITDLLPAALAEQLLRARRSVGSASRLDEKRVLPAVERYSGTLYSSAGTSLLKAAAAGRQLMIVSGAYGLVLANELIGTYDRRFSPLDWPNGLLENCLLTACRCLGIREVLALCARSTGYSALVRRARGASTASRRL